MRDMCKPTAATVPAPTHVLNRREEVLRPVDFMESLGVWSRNVEVCLEMNWRYVLGAILEYGLHDGLNTLPDVERSKLCILGVVR